MQVMNAIDSDGVKGWLDQPAGAAGPNGLVLTHGAGSNSNAPILKAVSAKLCEHGWRVLRIDLPFRQKHGGPPRPNEAAADREGLRRALAVLRGESSRLWMGGHSYGGRQATMLAAEDAALDIKGLLLLSYPLHPPAKPQQLRTTHLPELQFAAFFAQGSRDDFGTRQEMEHALSLIPAPTLLVTVEGAGHDLGSGKKLDFLTRFLEFAAGV
jgi:predicted alpha/beta-hydrolase family hydrolase